METLTHILQHPGSRDGLDRATLELAQLEDDGFEVAPYLCQLDQWASDLRQGAIDRLRGYTFVLEFQRFFFDELGFHGNREDYFNPANSFLNQVMDRRTGIPITLSVAYIELARRLGREVQGVGFPGHFLVKVVDGDFSELVDVFNCGRILSETDCFEMGVQMTGIDYSSRPEVLWPVDSRTILIRMLNNLRGIYINRKANRKLLGVLDLLLLADPGNAEEYFTRAMTKMNLHLYVSAERDLLHFLQLMPESDLKEEVTRHLELARVMRSQMN
ncbi:MAG: transglutaminase family protein [Bryobacterales bacterium]|nr:transglutaminase family protein [Bryobacterales bacterium]